MKSVYYYEFSIGKIGIAQDDKYITDIFFVENFSENKAINAEILETDLIKKTKTQIKEYLDGVRKEFDIDIKLNGTEFQKSVWKKLMDISYGKVVSYGEIAESIQNPKAARAVGMANNKNPIAIIIPCHRVIGKNGSLVGYAGGLNIKEKLLNLEKANI